MILFLGIFILGVLAMSNSNISENVSRDDRFDVLFKRYGNEYGLPWKWLKAIAMNESSLGEAKSVRRGLEEPSDVKGSVSSDGKSWGLMQLTLPTARQFESMVTEVGLNNPEVSVRIAAKYLSWVIRNYYPLTDQESIIRSYNGGVGFKKTVQGIRDTPEYYRRFLRNLEIINNRQKD